VWGPNGPNVSNVLVLVYLLLFQETPIFILLLMVIIHRCKFENRSLQFLNVLISLCFHQMCVRLLTTFVVASDLFVLLLYYIYFVCILYFVLNFLHYSTGQKLMLSGRCLLSILLFPFIFYVYLVYDCIIKKENKCFLIS